MPLMRRESLRRLPFLYDRRFPIIICAENTARNIFYQRKYLGMNRRLINLNTGKKFSIFMNIGQKIRLPSRSTGTSGITRLLFFKRQHAHEKAVTRKIYLTEYISSVSGEYAPPLSASASSVQSVNSTAGSSG